MKVLYAIQGTGNGHVSRAREIIPLLQRKCETDILISGCQCELDLPFDVKYRLEGLSFIFGKKGGADFRKTYKKANTNRLLREIRELPVTQYDFVLNDFEPVSAWACYRKKVPCISLSHQASLLDKNTPRPSQKDALGNFILKNYAPASYRFGFHFSRYSNNIYTPVLRKEIREGEKKDKGHYLVYLPAYDDNNLIKVLRKITDVEWHVYSKHCKAPISMDHIIIKPVNGHLFIESLLSCRGVLCGAGFETPAEALFLGKKLMVVPMQNQYEQLYNAAALKSIGVPVIKRFKTSQVEKISEWVNSDFRIEITYPDVTDRIINRIFELFVEGEFPKGKWKEKYLLRPVD
jgi:uncharacterized protein (TIGR00661 family)